MASACRDVDDQSAGEMRKQRFTTTGKLTGKDTQTLMHTSISKYSPM